LWAASPEHKSPFFPQVAWLHDFEEIIPARSNLDTLPKRKMDTIQTKDISKESIEDSDFIIKNPRHTLQIKRTGPNGLGKPLIDPKQNSRKAWLFSAVLPGLGQFYNHSYLKIPIVYGALVSGALVLNFYQKLYTDVLSAYSIRLKNDQSLNVPAEYNYIHISASELVSVKDYYRRNRDLSIISIAGIWAIQTVDAFVVSELKGFDVSNDLSLKIRPTIIPYQSQGNPLNLGKGLGFGAGLSLTLNFR